MEDIGFILLPTELCSESVRSSCGSFVSALENKTANIGMYGQVVLFARLDPFHNLYIHCENRAIAVINKIISSPRENIEVFRVGEYGFGMVIEEDIKIYLPETSYIHNATASA